MLVLKCIYELLRCVKLFVLICLFPFSFYYFLYLLTLSVQVSFI